MRRSSWQFDKQDRDMLAMVNRVLCSPDAALQTRLFDANLHPHGIKDLVLSHEFRVAYAVINLLSNLEVGQAEDRLRALQSLYDEALASAQSVLRRNTARVLIQIMKHLVRSADDACAQLKLAHDFRRAAAGTPRVVRRMLKRYHLPEMPEEWNQIAFDDHVHDANTKGRKTPTHLIMDAWVKGIRQLTVVYYNFVDEAAAREILAASAIMGITVRIGLEFRTPFRGRYISLTWIPRGFTDSANFLEFLQEHKVVDLMHKGREASNWAASLVVQSLRHWNTVHRLELSREWGIDIPPLEENEFRAYVGSGQASRVHLAEALLRHLQPFLQKRAQALEEQRQAGDPDAEATLKALDSFGFESVMDSWLNVEQLTLVPGAAAARPTSALEASAEAANPIPEIMTMPPALLLSWLTDLHSGYRIVLNLATLTAEDVLELLWDGQGAITHLELFNLKDWHEGRLTHVREISELQTALNEGRGPRIKQLVRQMIARMERNPAESDRMLKFQIILHNVPLLWEYYKNAPLKNRMGSDSTSRMVRNFGMGLVFPETLPARGQHMLRHNADSFKTLPVAARVEEHITYTPGEAPRHGVDVAGFVRRFPLLHRFGKRKARQWTTFSDTARIVEDGNVVTLGGVVQEHSNHLLHGAPQGRQVQLGSPVSYMNAKVTNWLKVLAGFVPSMFSFWYTQDWWFMVWFGTLIWFAITGVRNVVQMVLAGRGVSRTTLVRWKDNVSISRMCDSFMYTGISVFLLEVMTRVWLLEDILHISVQNSPFLVFLLLNTVNGLYICAHNLYRGFPREAAIGNLFRSALAIPMSMLYNSLFLQLLIWAGTADPLFYVVPSAAILSKLASDTVAALIEGYADSKNNLRMRTWDYESKLLRVFDCYTRLEMLFPEEDVLRKLAHSGGLGKRAGVEAREVERALIINALDLMYFWFYLPRAQHAFAVLLRSMPQADRTVLAHSQLVLAREREISQLFVDGLLGKSFARPLAFYLGKRKEYIAAMARLCTPGRTHDTAPDVDNPGSQHDGHTAGGFA